MTNEENTITENLGCRECGSENWKIIARRYCKKCYPLILKKELLENNDGTNELNIFSLNIEPISDIGSELREEKIRYAKGKINARLELHKVYNKNVDIKPYHIRNYLIQIGELINNHRYHDLDTIIPNNYEEFSNEILRVIACDLAAILLSKKIVLSDREFYYSRINESDKK